MTQRIATLTLDEHNAAHRSAELEHERLIATTDLLTTNHFAPHGMEQGPYDVSLKREEQRLVFDIAPTGGGKHHRVTLPLTPFKGIIRDYFLICESYYAAIKEAKPHKLEAIDMGRRGIHNEGAELLTSSLAGKIELDHQTARRLFTLICVLCLK